jgi:hypothetical protein
MNLVRKITFGPFVRKYNFRVWGKDDGMLWENKPYARRARGLYTRSWNGESTMEVPFSEVLEDNGAIREFAGLVTKIRVPTFGTRMLEDPRVSVDVGDLRVSIRIGGAKLQQNLDVLKGIRNDRQLENWLNEGKFWRISYKNNPRDDAYPGMGWCGYLAIDQIRRGADLPVRLSEADGIKSMIDTLSEVVTHGHGPLRQNWRSVPEKGRTPREVVSSVIEILRQSRSFLI